MASNPAVPKPGARAVGRRIGALYLTVAILGLNAVLMFAGLELVSMAAFKGRLWLLAQR